MMECPHCGEPIAEDAERCPHCGSDAETGWNPDQDYYSVELPEDDTGEGEGGQGPGLRWPAIAVAVLVAGGAVGFVSIVVGLRGKTPLLMLLAGAVLALSIWASARHRS